MKSVPGTPPRTQGKPPERPTSKSKPPGERSGEGVDSVRLYLEQVRKVRPSGSRGASHQPR